VVQKSLKSESFVNEKSWLLPAVSFANLLVKHHAYYYYKLTRWSRVPRED
jgi:hypothetical protein